MLHMHILRRGLFVLLSLTAFTCNAAGFACVQVTERVTPD